MPLESMESGTLITMSIFPAWSKVNTFGSWKVLFFTNCFWFNIDKSGQFDQISKRMSWTSCLLDQGLVDQAASKSPFWQSVMGAFGGEKAEAHVLMQRMERGFERANLRFFLLLQKQTSSDSGDAEASQNKEAKMIGKNPPAVALLHRCLETPVWHSWGR